MTADDPYAVLAEMLDDASGVPAWVIPRWAASHAARLGARALTVYLQDYEQRRLVPITGESIGSELIGPVAIEGTLPGRAYAYGQTEQAEPDGVRLYTAMVDGTNRVGVLELLFDGVDDERRVLARRLAAVTTSLIVSKGAHTDVYFRARRSRAMTLAAEMQWHLLPPLSVTDPRVDLAGVLEPAYAVGGDAFDYAINHGTAHIAIFDAMGHGLPASLMSAVAVGGYRHARRLEVPVTEMYRLIDSEFSSQFGADRFVTAQLAELELGTGTFRLVNAGHPPPLLIRDGHVVRTLAGPTTLPIGLDGPDPDLVVEMLQPGDALLLYSDGVVEARRGAEVFGDSRLVELVESHLREDLRPAELLRRVNHRLLDWQTDGVHDDSTLLFVRWRSPELPAY